MKSYGSDTTTLLALVHKYKLVKATTICALFPLCKSRIKYMG